VETAMNQPLSIGTQIKPYGKVIAIAWLGERYYFLSDERGSVAMMPATTIEAKI
jgi:hypothetical protein